MGHVIKNFYYENVKRKLFSFRKSCFEEWLSLRALPPPPPPLNSKFVFFRSRDHRALQGDSFHSCLFGSRLVRVVFLEVRNFQNGRGRGSSNSHSRNRWRYPKPPWSSFAAVRRIQGSNSPSAPALGGRETLPSVQARCRWGGSLDKRETSDRLRWEL